MRLLKSISAIALFAACASGQETNRITITTLSGRTYSDATVLRLSSDSVTLMLPDGLARIAATNLPTQVRAQLGTALPDARGEERAPPPPQVPKTAEEYASKIAALINPNKLAGLTGTAANPRMQKVVYWIEVARLAGLESDQVCAAAVAMAGMSGYAAELTSRSILRSRAIAERLGCLDTDGLAEMRKGQAPTVRKGPYAGDQLSVDHVIPRSVCPELASVIANLELMPMQMNREKSDRLGDRQIAYALELQKAGLLGPEAVARMAETGR